MFPTVAWLFAAALLAGSAEEGQGLSRAVESYELGDYTAASAGLEGLLDRSLSPELESRARLYLSASYFAVESKALARSSLEKLFAKEPEAKVDPALFPPAFRDFAEEARRELDAARKVDLTPRPDPALNLRAPEPKPPPFGLAFVPFGVGHFVTQRTGKGMAFMALEAAGLTVAAVGKLSFESLRLPGGESRFSDPGKASKLQWTFLGALWATVGVAAYGVIDAAWDWPSAPAEPAPVAPKLSGRT